MLGQGVDNHEPSIAAARQAAEAGVVERARLEVVSADSRSRGARSSDRRHHDRPQLIVAQRDRVALHAG
jgi:hypothetical protein